MVARKVVLVEGKDDEHVIKHLCGNRGIPPVLTVEGHQSVENLLEAIPVQLKASYEGDIVGIVLDADESLIDRWAAVRNQLAKLSYKDLPAHPAATGIIIEPPAASILPRVGIWLMPDNRLNGMLEDFLALLVPKNSPLFTRVQNSVDQIPQNERLFSKTARSKAVIHTWLAWQKDPGLPFGTAITARFLDPLHSEADTFVAWLRELYRV